MSEQSSMMVERDVITEADVKALAGLTNRERARVEEFVREVDDGTIIQGSEKREVFTFTEPTVGTFVFDVRSIKDGMLEGRIPAAMYRIEEVPEYFYQHVLANNGVDPKRLAGRAFNLTAPGIMVDWNNGYQTLIDGNHRLCWRYQRGRKSFRFLLVRVADCVPHMARPSEEAKLFHGDRPGVVTLHTEIKIEDETSQDGA